MLPFSALTAVQTPITTMLDCSYSAHTESTHMHPATQGVFYFVREDLFEIFNKLSFFFLKNVAITTKNVNDYNRRFVGLI